MTDEQLEQTDREAKKWKRRERAFAAGVVIWALAVTAIATLAPEATANWLLTREPLATAGALMVSIGICAGFCETVLLAVDEYATEDRSDLTEVPWDE